MTTQYTIAQVLPHRDHMLLLEELVSFSPEQVVTALTIRPDTTFFDGVGGVPAWVGMEYMAQTASVFSGIEDRRAGIEPRVSALLGSRAYHAKDAVFPLGARLLVRATLVMRDDNDLAVFDCDIEHEGNRLAWGDIKAIRPQDIQTLVHEQMRERQT